MCSPHGAISLDPGAIISSKTVWSNINYLKWGRRDKRESGLVLTLPAREGISLMTPTRVGTHIAFAIAGVGEAPRTLCAVRPKESFAAATFLQETERV